jgi:repressor LexA
MKGLTSRQREVLNYIEEFIRTHGHSPSYREIMVQFDLSSVGTVYKHIQVLKRKGMLSAEKQCSRSLVLSSGYSQSEIQVPFIGNIAAGSPIETFSQTKNMAVPKFLIHDPNKTYILQAKDETLNDELIHEGDFLIVEARQDVHQGDTIVAMLSHHETIIKKYHCEGSFIRLTGHNPHQKPILLRPEELQIQGVVIGLFRLFHDYGNEC